MFKTTEKFTSQTKLMFTILMRHEFIHFEFERLRSRKQKKYRYVLIVIDNFSKFRWTVPLKNKNAQTIKDSFETVLISSKENKFNRN